MPAVWPPIGCVPRQGRRCVRFIAGRVAGRSRGRLWRKGETSGQVQRLVALRIDCDGDTLVLQVDQTGVACHTGRRSCFYRTLADGRLEEILPVEVDPDALYKI